jgi:hypothetical protein
MVGLLAQAQEVSFPTSAFVPLAVGSSAWAPACG